MGDFAKDVDFHKNKIKNAKVDIPDRNSIDPDDAIDRQYVDDVDVYETVLSANVTIQPTHGTVKDRTLVHGKTTRQVLDEILYPLVLAKYVKPTIEFSVQYMALGTSTPVTTIEPGMLVDVWLQATVTLNDSPALSTNAISLSGNGIPTIVNGLDAVTMPTYKILNFPVPIEGTWNFFMDYVAATVKTDSRGNTDTVGLTGYPYFTSGQTPVQTITVNANWPWYVLDSATDLGTITSSTLNGLLAPGKQFGNVVQGTEIDIAASGTRYIYFAIPLQEGSATIPNIEVVKDGAMPVQGSFSSSLLLNVPDLSSSGQTRNYAVFFANNGAGFDQPAKYKFKTL